MITTLYNAFLACNGVCTDSRACQAGNLFVCLKGENFDGNDYAEKAVEKLKDKGYFASIAFPTKRR